MVFTDIGYRFKPIGGHIRRPSATNGVSTLRGDEESACAHKLATLKGGKVLATVVRHGKGAKVSVIKFKRRAHYLRQKTHRQPFTELKVTDISAG
jgi:ribosomal protein L21